jgi:hypothetical protein
MRKTIIAALFAVGLVPAAALAGPRDHDHDHDRYDGGRGGSHREERYDRDEQRRYGHGDYGHGHGGDGRYGHGRYGHGYHGYRHGWYYRTPHRDRYYHRDRDHTVHYHTYRHAVRHKDHYHIHEHVRPHVHHHHD